MRDLLVIAHGKLQHGSAGRRWARAELRLREVFGGGVEIRFTSAKGDAATLTRAALDSGAGWLAAAGGDGTIHEVVNGFFVGGENIRPDVPLSFLPCGSGNDWTRTLEIPGNLMDAVTSLHGSCIRRVDVGIARYQTAGGRGQERVFLNVAEAGVGGKVVALMNAHPGIARTRVGYRLGTMAAALIHRRQILEVAIDGNPAISTGPTLSFIIAGGRYFGAGMKCAPMARLDDGLFEVIILGDFSPAELLYKIHRFFSGTYLDDRKITHRTARSIDVRSAAQVLLELDGELVGTLPASFRILPGALAIRC